jgi:23S rRNA (guanine2445-N2)-methyltransferase / 23S rRNA (guanine2069-N7)-methyltransferase
VPALWRKLHEEAQARAQAGLAKPPLWIRGYEADPRLIQPGATTSSAPAWASGQDLPGRSGHLRAAPGPEPERPGDQQPAYGERLGDEASLLYLYQNLGERLRQACMGWEAAVFTGAPELGKRMGIRSHKQYAFWNGALPCKLLLFKVQPDQFVTGERRQAQVEEGQERRPAPQASEPARCPKARRCSPTACRRTSSSWASGPAARSTATACTMPTCPSTPWRSTCTTTGCMCRNTPRRVHRPGKGPGALLDALAAIPQALGVDQQRVVLKRRERQSGTRQYERQATEGRFQEVSEGGVKLLVNLTDYLDTGLFLDHRPMRMRIQREAGKRFLNLFCYTATATVHAAKGGRAAPPASTCRKPTWTGRGATCR